MKFQTDLNKLINIAQNKGNWSAYGWIMRCMQVEDDMVKLDKERKEVYTHIDRVRKELENQEGDI